MLKTKYDILTRNGKEQFVVIPLADFKALMELTEDEADHRAIAASKKRNAGKPLVPHDQVMRDFGLSPTRTKRKA
jgi:PHD/YefM family antitoxin component YafN of YafNO toxin-antitoxin module